MIGIHFKITRSNFTLLWVWGCLVRQYNLTTHSPTQTDVTRRNCAGRNMWTSKPSTAPIRRQVRSWLRSGVLHHLVWYNCVCHLASSCLYHVSISDYYQLKFISLWWYWADHRSYRVSWKSWVWFEIWISESQDRHCLQHHKLSGLLLNDAASNQTTQRRTVEWHESWIVQNIQEICNDIIEIILRNLSKGLGKTMKHFRHYSSWRSRNSNCAPPASMLTCSLVENPTVSQPLE